jgi:hypothetical protein
LPKEQEGKSNLEERPDGRSACTGKHMPFRHLLKEIEPEAA